VTDHQKVRSVKVSSSGPRLVTFSREGTSEDVRTEAKSLGAEFMQRCERVHRLQVVMNPAHADSPVGILSCANARLQH
jgi:hypothetical protein